MNFDWKKIVSSVAPMLGAALGGPFGAIAGKALGEVLGVEATDQKALEKAVLGASPEQFIALQKADQEFKTQMTRLGFENEQALLTLEVQDRSSARDREKVTGDSWTLRILSSVIVLGWVGVQFWLLKLVIDVSMREIVMRMLGTLDAALMLVLSYYFGSSLGSTIKTSILGNKQ